jgi:hypothetical protein
MDGTVIPPWRDRWTFYSGKERLKIAFEMWDIAFAQAKTSEKSLNPNLNEKEIERRARQRMTDGAIRSS